MHSQVCTSDRKEAKLEEGRRALAGRTGAGWKTCQGYLSLEEPAVQAAEEEEERWTWARRNNLETSLFSNSNFVNFGIFFFDVLKNLCLQNFILAL